MPPLSGEMLAYNSKILPARVHYFGVGVGEEMNERNVGGERNTYPMQKTR